MPLHCLINLATNHDVLVYGLIVVLAGVEGPILSVILGALIRLDVFPLAPVLAAVMAGDLIGDAAWYYVGRRFGHRFIGRFGKYFHVTETEVEWMTRLFHRHKHPILFLSKISNGLGLALVTLTTAGIVRIPFWKFMAVNAAGQLVFSSALIGAGYFFSQAYLQINNLFGRMALVAAAVVALAALLRYGKSLRHRTEKPESNLPS